MIARSFAARATPGGAAAYAAFFRATLVPQLAAIAGHRGALVLTAPEPGGAVAITVITLWDSMEAIAHFAGDRPERAVVEPEARAVLTWFANEVVHQEVAVAALGVE